MCKILPQSPHKADFGSSTMLFVATEPPNPGRDRNRTRPLQSRLLAYRAAESGDVDVEGLDIQRVVVTFALSGLWIDDDQFIADHLKDRSAIVAFILPIRQDSEIAQRSDEARIIRL